MIQRPFGNPRRGEANTSPAITQVPRTRAGRRRRQGFAPTDETLAVTRAVDAREPRAAHAVGATRRTLHGVTAGAHHRGRDGRLRGLAS